MIKTYIKTKLHWRNPEWIEARSIEVEECVEKGWDMKLIYKPTKESVLIKNENLLTSIVSKDPTLHKSKYTKSFYLWAYKL